MKTFMGDKAFMEGGKVVMGDPSQSPHLENPGEFSSYFIYQMSFFYSLQ